MSLQARNQTRKPLTCASELVSCRRKAYSAKTTCKFLVALDTLRYLVPSILDSGLSEYSVCVEKRSSVRV